MNKDFYPPLAERIRPSSLNDFIGQKHILDKDKLLRKMIDSSFLQSMILWGPPGSGKTSLAKIISNTLSFDFYQVSAVSSGVKELRDLIEKAQINFKNYRKPSILFIDEIHRFNKLQQDALLHSIEDGSVILIGATTENPSFEVIAPVLSRCIVFTLNPLRDDELNEIIVRALTEDEILSKKNIKIEDRTPLFQYSGKDARVMLNTLERAVSFTKENENGEIILTAGVLTEAFLKKSKYDKLGEEHYNTISAFIKSMRGSDPDGAVFWLARMLDGGEDVKFIARRMIILASEDIGNAEPDALNLAVSCFNAVNVVGMPEARIILSQCAAYLASCPKSNASYLAIEEALSDIKENPAVAVPLHLRNAPTPLMKELDYHKGYKYTHSYEDHFIIQDYLPSPLSSKIYYKPQDTGKEKDIKKYLEGLWKGKKKYD